MAVALKRPLTDVLQREPSHSQNTATLQEKHLKSLRNLFVQVGLSGVDAITFDAFEERALQSPV